MSILLGGLLYVIMITFANVFIRCTGIIDYESRYEQSDLIFWSVLWPVGIFVLVGMLVLKGTNLVATFIAKEISPHKLDK